MTKNEKQFFADSASATNDHRKQMQEQTLQILLNNANMTNLGPNVISDTMIAEELTCTKRLVQMYHNTTVVTFKNMRPAA